MPVKTFLAGGGEAGALIRSFDWAATPLGKPDEWPETLRTALAVCLNSTIASAVYWGPDFITLYNDAWAQQQAGRHPWAMGRPARESRQDIWETIRPQFEQVAETGRGVSVTDQPLAIQREGDRESWWSYSIIPLHTADGTVGGLLTQGFETTAQIRARQVLDREMQRLREMFEQAPGAVAILRGPEHVFEIANDAYFELVGQRRDILGKPMAIALPEVVEQGFVELMDNVYRTGEPFVGRAVPVALTRVSGELETRMVDFVYQPIRNAIGEVTDIFVEATDVTERVLGEATLRESEERFRLVSDSAPVMLWMGDANGRCLYLNRAQRDFWDVPEANVSTFDWNTTIHPEDVAKLAAPFMKGMSEQTGFSVEARYRRADGEYRLLSTTAQPRFGPEGEFLGMIGVNADVTEVREAQASLSRSNDELEAAVRERTDELMRAEGLLRQAQKMEAIGQLTGGIAHDFNNMLAVVTSGLNLVQRKLSRGDTDVGRYIEGAMDGARRAASLTSRLLAFSRQQQLAPEPLDANALISGMTDLVARTLGAGIKVETALVAGLWPTMVDANQLESAILNLAVNARDAMEHGGRLVIETANAVVGESLATEYAIAAGDYVTISVADSGVGMTQEVMAKAFDPFFTTKPVGKGTGLGLSQVFGFIRQSGGHVKIKSEPGEGTAVCIYLPRSLVRDAAAERKLSSEVAHGMGEIVMVVEDEERVRAHSVEALKELGYTVIEARSPVDALRMIESGMPMAMLFTDVVMPEMNGRQLAEKAARIRPGLKVLYTTGYTGNAGLSNGLLDPGTVFVAKPFTIEQLGQKVRQILDS